MIQLRHIASVLGHPVRLQCQGRSLVVVPGHPQVLSDRRNSLDRSACNCSDGMTEDRRLMHFRCKDPDWSTAHSSSHTSATTYDPNPWRHPVPSTHTSADSCPLLRSFDSWCVIQAPHRSLHQMVSSHDGR